MYVNGKKELNNRLSKRQRHSGRSHGERFSVVNSFMARAKDVMTRQVSRQLQRLRWKAMFKVAQRRGQRCPYERSAA